MQNGFTDNFLAGTIIAAIFSLIMLASSMLYAIFIELDNSTDITVTAEHVPGDTGFDPNALPAPAAGKPGNYNCKDMSYQVTDSGLKYVRELGGVYNAAIINGQFGLYQLEYGNLQPVGMSALDPDSILKLRYALENCKETYIRSGALFLAGMVSPWYAMAGKRFKPG